MVLPHLDYCSVIWAECCKDDATKLERIRKSGMQLILNEGWNCQYSVIRSRLGWTSLANRRRMMRAAYIRRCMQGFGPSYMRNMLMKTWECAVLDIQKATINHPTGHVGSKGHSSSVQEETGIASLLRLEKLVTTRLRPA